MASDYIEDTRIKILTIADLHGDIKPLRKYLQNSNGFEPDFIFCVGDNSGHNIHNFDFKTKPGIKIIDKKPEGFDQRSWLINQFKSSLKHKFKNSPIIDLNGNHDFGNRKDIFDYSLFKGTKVIKLKDLKIGLMTGSLIYKNEYHDEISEKEIAKRIKKIDKNIDILLTHVPPHGILDKSFGKHNQGSIELRKALDGKKPYFTKVRLHVFGHVHGNSGCEILYIDNRMIHCINSAQAVNEIQMNFGEEK